MVDDFVSKVNSLVRHKEELEKVKAVLQRLTTTSVVHDIPSGWEKVFIGIFSNLCIPSSLLSLQCLQPYRQLDLLAPMVGINPKQLRTLILEGALRYKEDTTKVSLTMLQYDGIHGRVSCTV